ncbi:MAG: nicotinate-nucleotide diphosphorylase [Planctomycetaceae bacterium]|nr:nicotinate-nucleotide diphosphorylase [Planctomycetaceae bacterium]
MKRDYNQMVWDEQLSDDVRKLIALAISEDLGTSGDITTQALVPEHALGKAVMHSRQTGVAAGLPAVPAIAAIVDSRLHWEPFLRDGDTIGEGRTPLGAIAGPVASILTAERMILNLVGRLCGIATLTRSYVQELAGTNARIYDTRKTTLGWRRLEKYAVRCGGGTTHRTGLFDAILIKDNHLAFGMSGDAGTGGRYTPAEAVRKAREWGDRYVRELAAQSEKVDPASTINTLRRCGIQVALKGSVPNKYKLCGIDVTQKSLQNLLPPLVEIEVDSLEQLAEVLPESPDVAMLDNMTPERIHEAVEMRNKLGVPTELEASGGVNLKTVRAIAETGVERISVGALTHSAISLDIGLDYTIAN